MQKNTTRSVLILCTFAALLPGLCWAWGAEGHETVGLIAERFLTPQARQSVARILGGGSLGENRVADWADFIRGNKRYDRIFPGNHMWHYIDVDIATPESEFTLPSDGNDIVDQLIFWQKELASKDASDERRRDALRFIVHFAADVHQPLHCAFRDDDRGGNLVPIRSFRGENYFVEAMVDAERPPNLHKVWDEYLVYDVANGRSAVELAETLVTNLQVSAADGWRQGGPKDWAWETHLLAVAHAYKFSDGTSLPRASDNAGIDLTRTNYIDANLPIVREQLQRAGVRLAKLINDAFGEGPNGDIR